MSTAKASLRETVRERLKLLSVAERAAASARICERLLREPWFAQAGAVLLYAPLKDEPDVWPVLETLLEEARQDAREPRLIASPRFDSGTGDYLAARIVDPARDIVPGAFGVREPAAHCPAVPLNRLDLILVPGVAFDACGGRLGRGKGFYDRLLARVRGRTCGVAFDEQVVEAVPVEPHDVRLNCILTPTRLIET